MKFKILKSVGRYGVVVGSKSFVIGDHIDIELDGAEEGVLAVNKRACSVVNGKARIPECFIVNGDNSVVFTDESGTYDCGGINKSGRFITVSGATDELVAAYAATIENQGARIEALEEAVKTIKKQYGISII